ncbi:MAG: hypothetical protein BWY73_01259 [candidate division TA06 bacterium ADurb.Bin417]|uniref:Uncharacterized protein n=1 Tax=candidate division TA06 bacterium ADurb.Bin417 TaxID=1852828 RepID=A0A1V5MBX7_UNCT6|nr:MAG: hypothetical protein BWY73_01259 [candidate division TA06 bacterium ADurb.Bin417]
MAKQQAVKMVNIRPAARRLSCPLPVMFSLVLSGRPRPLFHASRRPRRPPAVLSLAQGRRPVKFPPAAEIPGPYSEPVRTGFRRRRFSDRPDSVLKYGVRCRTWSFFSPASWPSSARPCFCGRCWSSSRATNWSWACSFPSGWSAGPPAAGWPAAPGAVAYAPGWPAPSPAPVSAWPSVSAWSALAGRFWACCRAWVCRWPPLC